MGFFSDLKEDLSQAVNELVPEEGTESAQKAEMDALTVESGQTADVVAEEETGITKQDMEGELASLLEKMEEEEAPVAESSFTRKGAEKAVSGFGARSIGNVSDETAVITAGMKITGDIVSEGSLDITGTIEGNIDILGKLNVTGTIGGNSKAAEIYAENAKITGEVRSEGSVKIGQSSVVIGNLFATSAVIAGAVKGDIDVHGPVILDSSAIVMGNIKSKTVQINNGAVIEGLCSQCYAEVNPTSFFEEIKKAKK